MQSKIAQSAYHKAFQLLGGEFAKKVRDHAEIYERGLLQLARAELDDKPRMARSAQDRLLKSFSAKVVCLVRCLDDQSGLAADEVESIAANLDPRTDCGEKILFWAKPKSSGNGWRPLCSFGIKRQALHRLVADILEARFGIDELNYLSRGKGAECASDWIVDQYENRSSTYFVLADIENFFRSVQNGKIGRILGLPEDVVKHSVLISPEAALSLGEGFPSDLSIQTLVGAAQQGLPQGSRASQIIAGLLLGPTLRKVALADRGIVHGDDIALAARTSKEANALKDALVEALEFHPAGPFRLKHCNVEYVNAGFDFLQYRHRRDAYTGRIHRRPAARSYAKFHARIVTYFAKYPFREAFRFASRYRWLWMRSFRRWRKVELSKLALWQSMLRSMEEGRAERKKTLDLEKIG